MAGSDCLTQKETQGKACGGETGKENTCREDSRQEAIDPEEDFLSAMAIEVATIEDAQAILELQKLAYQSEAAIYADYTIPPLVQSLAEMEQDFQRQTILKATFDGEIIGSVRGHIKEGTCYIGRLIVHPDYQNRGLGRQILKAIEDHFAEADRYELFTGRRSERNLYFYQKMGYRIFRSEQLTDLVTVVYMEKIGD